MEIFTGDSLDILKKLSSESVYCVITSPPYFGLRDYGVEGQIGLEETPDEFISKLVEVFREIRRVLKNDGTLWLNIGDSYAGSGKGQTRQGSKDPKRGKLDGMKLKNSSKGFEGIKPKDMIGIPWMLAFALRADGWYLRQDIIWSKPNPMPESVYDRCTKAHEYIFLLSKSSKYFYDNKSIEEPSVGKIFPPVAGHAHGKGSHNSIDHAKPTTKYNDKKKYAAGGTSFIGHKGNFKANGEPINKDNMRNKRSVWSIATKPFAEAHFATFPEALIEPMVMAGCPKGGIVLDPFFGAGTTGVVAKKLGRDYIGIELNKEYIEIAEKRLSGTPNPLF